jgi:hypothetical protein
VKVQLKIQTFAILASITALFGLVYEIIDLIPVINVINCCLCCVILAGPVIGAFYAVKDHQITKDQGLDALIVGALAGVVMGLTYGVISFIFSIISSITGRTAEAFASVQKLFPNMDLSAYSSFGANTILASIVGIIVQTVFFIIVAAIAGLISSLFMEEKK